MLLAADAAADDGRGDLVVGADSSGVFAATSDFGAAAAAAAAVARRESSRNRRRVMLDIVCSQQGLSSQVAVVERTNPDYIRSYRPCPKEKPGTPGRRTRPSRRRIQVARSSSSRFPLSGRSLHLAEDRLEELLDPSPRAPSAETTRMRGGSRPRATGSGRRSQSPSRGLTIRPSACDAARSCGRSNERRASKAKNAAGISRSNAVVRSRSSGRSRYDAGKDRGRSMNAR